MVLLDDTIACQFSTSIKIFTIVFFSCFFACKQKPTIEKDVLPFYNTPQFDAEWISEKDNTYSSIHTIENFNLTNQLGHLVNNDSLKGKIYIANFFFTTCLGICPKMTANFKTLQDTFLTNNQIKLLSFSVMPWVDTVQQLKKYAVEHQINSNKWYLLTGSKSDIYNLARKSFFAEKGLGLQKDTTQFLHTESMLLIDTKGRIRGIYNATQKVDISRVYDDVQVLLKEGHS
jgi:protein SCO1/2